MGFDGTFLRLMRSEIADRVIGCRIDKINQPTRNELVFSVRSPAFAGKLLLSCSPSGARMQLTEHVPENPSVPPMFCMLLRRRLTGARIVSLEQDGLERICAIRMDGTDELGDHVIYTLYAELMGRFSNLIVCGPDGRILDAVRRTDASDTTRVILPGARYLPPCAPAGKMDFSSLPSEQTVAWICESDQSLSDALPERISGLSPLVCRELVFGTLRGEDCPASSLNPEQKQRLSALLSRISEMPETVGTVPTLLFDLSGKPKDFTFLPILQYGNSVLTRHCDSLCALLDEFYAEREQKERMRARSQQLLKLLTNTSARLSRKIAAQREDLKKAQNGEHLRIYGELIKANLHSIPRGASFCDAVDYYDADCRTIRIPLDAALSPAQNAQKYFKEYRKACTAAQMLGDFIEKGQRELVYLDTVFDELSRADSEADLSLIRDELIKTGYLRLKGSEGKKYRSPRPLPPRRFLSDDDFEILAGRNNRQNEELTLKTASDSDMWLHVKNSAGAHVIISAHGNRIPDSTLLQAAIIAATCSKLCDSNRVPVDYCPAKQVKKAPGTPPGMVIYKNYNTLLADPDTGLCRRLSQNAGENEKD